MQRAKLFLNGKSQAVRLPKDFRFDGQEVFIKNQGHLVILIPIGQRFDAIRSVVGQFSADFMADRNQPTL